MRGSNGKGGEDARLGVGGDDAGMRACGSWYWTRARVDVGGGGITGFSSYMFTLPQLGTVSVLVNDNAQDLDDVVAYIWAAILDVELP